MSTLDELREQILTLNANAEMKRRKVLDSDLSARIEVASDEVKTAENVLAEARDAELAEQKKPLGSRALFEPDDDPVAEAEEFLSDAKAALDGLHALAEGSTIVLTFGRLDPDEWADLVRKHTTKQGTLDEHFNGALTSKCFRSGATAAGEDLGLEWAQIRKGCLTDGDMMVLGTDLIQHCREITVTPL